jgi:hypothetical protein
MSRLPTPGSDNGTWGTILNDFLSVSLTSGGLLNAGVVGTSQITDGTVTKAKLETSVQTSLGKADTALQSVTKADVGLGNVTNVGIIVLGPTDPVPGGTASGTIILRTT